MVLVIRLDVGILDIVEGIIEKGLIFTGLVRRLIVLRV